MGCELLSFQSNSDLMYLSLSFQNFVQRIVDKAKNQYLTQTRRSLGVLVSPCLYLGLFGLVKKYIYIH